MTQNHLLCSLRDLSIALYLSFLTNKKMKADRQKKAQGTGLYKWWRWQFH